MPFTDRTMASIDELIATEGLAMHPLLASWEAGEPSRDDLRAFATQFHHHVDAFGRYVSTVHANAEDPAVRRVLVGLLVEVEGGRPTLSELWLQTCAALGLFSDSVRAAECTSSTQACLNDFFYLCQAGTTGGLVALYTFLRQLPPLCRTQSSAFAANYGMSSGPGLEFCDVASYMATQRGQQLRSLLERTIASEQGAREAVAAAEASLRAVCGLFSGATAATAAATSAAAPR